MGQEFELEHNDKSSLGLSPNTVLPYHQHHLNVKKKCENRKPTGKDDFLKHTEDFADIKFASFCVSSPKSLTCRCCHELEGDIEKKMGTNMGRKKIEISCRSSDDASISGSIVDSLCGSGAEDSDERPSVIFQDLRLASPSSSVSSSWDCLEHNTSNGFIEFCMYSDIWDKTSSAVEDLKIRSDNVSSSLIDVNSPIQNNTSKVEFSHLQSPSESDCSSRASPKVFTPIRKRLNPFTKSKYLTSPVSSVLETTEIKLTGTRNRTYQKSLVNAFSNAANNSDIISEFINRDIQHSRLLSSPVHLHANLKMKYKQGLPFFGFKVKCPELFFVVKTWRKGNDLDWIYTFHSIDKRKKSKDSSMVAQMLVSYDLCSELGSGLLEDNSMVTEFVLYDLAHSRKSVSPKEKSYSKQDVVKTRKASRVGVEGETYMIQAIENKLLSGNVGFENSNSYPLSSTELHPNLEIAATVLQIPFHKRESLKYDRGDRVNGEAYSQPGYLSSAVEQNRKSFHDRKFAEKVKVVLPSGSHGLPSDESKGPSSLLDRWRHGGGCDCGGWDMACPLLLLGNPSIQFSNDHPLMKEHQSLELLAQGSKESTPTFSMTPVEEGQYAVDFHAKLSPLQAFSICVAILHGTTATIQQLSQRNSLKMLTEEETEILIKSDTAEEKKTVPKIQKANQIPFVLSPIARV